MPLTDQHLEKYDRLRGRYEEMASRLLDLEPKDPWQKEKRTKVRSAAASYVTPAEARKRTGDPDSLRKIQSQMRHKVDEREKRIGDLSGTLHEVKAKERELWRADRETQAQATTRRKAEDTNHKEMTKKGKEIDDEMRKANKEMQLEKARHQHELAEARKEKTKLLAERRTRQNRAIKQNHKEEQELNFRHMKLLEQMEMAARDSARSERDFENRWRRLESEKARLKQEAAETKLALEMKAKMRRKQGDEFDMEQQRLERDSKKKLLSKEERDSQTEQFHEQSARRNDRKVQKVGMDRQYSMEKSKQAATREGMTRVDLRNKRSSVSEARRAVEDNVNFVEQHTLLGLADDRDEFAINKAKLLELEEKFDTFCGTVAEKQAWEKSIAMQVIEMKKKAHSDATKHAKTDFAKSSTNYKESLDEAKRATDFAKRQETLVSQLEANLAKVKAEHENRNRMERIKQRQEEERIQQQLLKEHSELTKAMCRKAGKETEMTAAATRMAEDALTIALEEQEVAKLSKIQPPV